MKTKKIILGLVVCLMIVPLALGLSACGKKDNNGGGNYSGQPFIGIYETANEGDDQQILEFKADKTGILTMDGDEYNFTYTVNGFAVSIAIAEEGNIKGTFAEDYTTVTVDAGETVTLTKRA